jgi:deoxyadenosine/deoxycytidine kinase
LNHRFKAHQLVTEGANSAIQDRSIYEDANIFARNLFETKMMSERDYRNYLDLYESMVAFLNPPDLVLYLRKSLPKLKEQITLRGREYEKNIPDDYLSSLNRYYDDWMSSYSLGKKLVIDSDDLNFLKTPADFELVCQKIVGALDQRDLFLDSKVVASKA